MKQKVATKETSRRVSGGPELRILLASVEFPDPQLPFCRRHCGAGYYALGLSGELAKRGYEIDVVTLSTESVDAEVSLPSRRVLAVSSYQVMRSRLRSLLDVTPPYAAIIRNDYVPGMSVTTGLNVSRDCRIIQIMHHGFEPHISGFVAEPDRNTFFRILCASADRVVTVSSWMAETVIRSGFGYDGPVDIVPGGRHLPDTLRLLFIGNLDSELRAQQKGLYDLLDAVRILRLAADLDVQLVLAGPLSPTEGPGRITQTKLKFLLEEREIASCVRIEPQYDDIEGLVNACTMGVQPSTVESFGGTTLSFLLKGKPVVATYIGGFREVVPQAFLSPPGDPEKLARKIREVAEALDTPRLSGRLGGLRCTLRRKFSWERQAAKFEVVLKKTLRAPSKRKAFDERSAEFHLLGTLDPLREHSGK